MKYIMFEQEINGLIRSVPIIFPDSLIHEEVYTAIHGLIKGNIVSAGTYSSFSGECSGKSTTLEIASRDIDTEIIQMYDYLHGVKL